MLLLGRENGTAALEFYSQTKTVYVEMNDVDCGQLYQGDWEMNHELSEFTVKSLYFQVLKITIF